MSEQYKITPAPLAELDHLGSISIAFEVRSIFKIENLNQGLDGLRLTETPVPTPYIKDYDAEDGDPVRWRRWDLTNWILLYAHEGETRIGAATVARKTAGVNMLQDRDDLAVLWDLRVAPAYRGAGVGKALFQAAVNESRERDCIEMKIETQNTNVPACRFYAAMGAALWSINRFAYPEAPHEAQVLWRVSL